MANKLPTPDPTRDDPADDAGWISGTMGNHPHRSAKLPEFSPAALVVEVQRLLAARGISVLVDLGSANTAITCAADLLRSLGVAPTNAPHHPR